MGTRRKRRNRMNYQKIIYNTKNTQYKYTVNNEINNNYEKKYKNVLTNILDGAIIMTSKENKRKTNQTK